MLVGILSDTHGRLPSAVAGLDALRAAGAEYLFHCGDVGSEPILDQLAGGRAALVWGNTDWDRGSLTRYARNLGIEVLAAGGECVVDGKRFAVAHGDDPGIIRRILDAQEHDYLLVGHTHVRDDRRVGRVRVINPGALYRTKEMTVALLDTLSDQLRFIPV